MGFLLLLLLQKLNQLMWIKTKANRQMASVQCLYNLVDTLPTWKKNNPPNRTIYNHLMDHQVCQSEEDFLFCLCTNTLYQHFWRLMHIFSWPRITPFYFVVTTVYGCQCSLQPKYTFLWHWFSLLPPFLLVSLSLSSQFYYRSSWGKRGN